MSRYEIIYLQIFILYIWKIDDLDWCEISCGFLYDFLGVRARECSDANAGWYLWLLHFELQKKSVYSMMPSAFIFLFFLESNWLLKRGASLSFIRIHGYMFPLSLWKQNTFIMMEEISLIRWLRLMIILHYDQWETGSLLELLTRDVAILNSQESRGHLFYDMVAIYVQYWRGRKDLSDNLVT